MTALWLVLVEGAGEPKHKHASLDLAKAEAERLVKLTGKKALVLQAVAECRPAAQPAAWHEFVKEGA